jgi:hypothetical protein
VSIYWVQFISSLARLHQLPVFFSLQTPAEAGTVSLEILRVHQGRTIYQLIDDAKGRSRTTFQGNAKVLKNELNPCPIPGVPTAKTRTPVQPDAFYAPKAQPTLTNFLQCMPAVNFQLA